MVFGRFIKVALIGLAIVGTAVASLVAPPEMVAEVNNHPAATWKAENSKWSQMHIEDAKSLMGAQINYANVFATDFRNARETSGLECSICEYALGWVEKEIDGNYTVTKIEDALDKVCSILPKTYRGLCDQLIETYTPELIDFILQKESPEVICELIKVCEPASIVEDSIECDLCAFAVGWVENKLQINATAQEVEALLTEVCDIIPKEYQAGCQEIVKEYGTDLINMLLKEISPDSICKMIGLCASELGALPTNFDGRQAFGKCIHPVRDQMQCGSCWAFSASEVLSDRFCIASKGQIDVVLSPQTLVSCDTDGNMGCQGGYLDKAWEFLVSNGIASDQCEPYTSGGGDSGTCPTKCADGSQIKYYKAANYKHITGVSNIQTELMTNGPVQAAFEVYQDFMSYKSGIYHHISGSLLGGHAVEMVGWGVENGTAYWTIKNSWGPSWGENGYFRIVKNVNECSIESNIFTGAPEL